MGHDRATSKDSVGSKLSIAELHDGFGGSIKEYQACLGTKTQGVSLQTVHMIGTSAYAPQRPMVTYTGMGTVGIGLHGLLRL
ncbi:hypothetical protein TNCV_3554461 [Trichonephila clavipes]|nr:hypothetical protein TNCV_3554461 [Trichonephila clavipes]